MGLTSDSVGKRAAEKVLKIEKRKEDDKVIALAGNPNVGKSTVFNGLTGMNQHTGNWPGKTVTIAQGYFRTENYGYVLVDLPGTYSLHSHSKEEETAKEFLCSGQVDAVAVVCDATCLERNLNLALQVIAMGCPVLICLNLLDEAEKKGIVIEERKLAESLGVPVTGVTARKKNSLGKLTRSLDELMQMLEKDEQSPAAEGRHRGENTVEIMQISERICQSAVTFTKKEYLARDRRLDVVLTGRRSAYPVMFLLLAVVLWITIAGANVPSGWLSLLFSRSEKMLYTFLSLAGIPEWIKEALTFGVFRVLGWVIAVMLPPMAIFFPLFTLLEDSGYLPRIAYNLDRPFQCCHACGKQALTMCMGLGCNAAGVVGCRIIDSRRERLIAILTNNFMPCNGRFPMLLVISTLFLTGMPGGLRQSFYGAVILTAIIALGAGMTFLLSRLLSETILKGEESSFTLELPPYRRPQIVRVLIHSLTDKTFYVLKRAAAVAAPAGLMIWLMANVTLGNVSLLTHCAEFLDPFAGLLGLDGTILMAFILGFPANEIVIPVMIMAYLSEGSLMEFGNVMELRDLLLQRGWTLETGICFMLFALMHWPCSTTLLTIHKETGSFKWTALALLLPTVTGMLCCFLTHLAFLWLAG